MKQFFGAFFGSLLGVIIAGVLSALILGLVIAGSIRGAFEGKENGPVKVKDNSVLVLKLDGPIQDRGIPNPFGDLDLGPFSEESGMGLNDILKNIHKAEKDSAIKGIYVKVLFPSAGFATVEEIRNALIAFRKSGKFVYTYSETYSQKFYYLATAGDKIFMNPQGGMELSGLSAQLMFFKKAFDKLDVEMQVFRHGKYKSAIEPFILDKMSEANRQQTESYLGSIWNHLLEGVATSRGLTVDELNQLANNLTINSPESAVEHKLIDELKYEDEVDALIRKKTGLAEKAKINYVTFKDYTHSSSKEKKTAKQKKIAVIYASGEINSGNGGDDMIGSERMAKAIREAREDSNIVAIVMRVNSPGGSALASDVIWREVGLAKKEKPFVVSMGDVAASGGYYISCGADYIFAEPNTITGSIGVFGLIPNIQRALSEKLGINIDTVNTNKHSDVGSILRPVSTQEYNYIQNGVEKVYDVFVTRVAEGRGLQKSQVDSIGQGRVWSGEEALKIKLVDAIGGLDAAIAYAAQKAKLNDYRLVPLPKHEDPLSKIFNKGEEGIEEHIMDKNLGKQYMYVKQLRTVLTMRGIQARLPYALEIE